MMKKRYWIAILCAVLALVLTVAAASADAGDVYGLATDASDLHNGDRIILVSDDGSYYQAMATDFSGMQVTVTDNTIIEQNGMLALTLTETEGGWLLASNDGYLAVDDDALAIVSDSADADPGVPLRRSRRHAAQTFPIFQRSRHLRSHPVYLDRNAVNMLK